MSEKYFVDLLRSTLRVYDDYCEISGKAGTLNRTKGTKKLYYSDLTSVQFKLPGGFFAGYIQFEYPGSDTTNKSPYESENAVVFNKKDNIKLMEEIYNFVERRISEEKQAKRAPVGTVIQQATSPAEELKKMKELLDMDIITQEEFDAKKKQLLGL